MFDVSFTPGPLPFPPTSICTADLNRDGHPDLIVAHSYYAALTVLTNDGGGRLFPSSTNGVAPGPICVVAVDVNGDGKKDLITANEGVYPTDIGSITVLTNNGYGLFVSNANYAMPSGLSCIAAADMDGDGSMDLIAANAGPVPYPRLITVLTNNGNGVFGSNAVYAVGDSTVFVVAVDWNGDGKMGLACANVNGNNLTVLTNDGSGKLTISSTNAVGTGPTYLAAADVTGDGKPDLICANSYINTLTVLLNSPVAPSLNLQPTATNTVALNWSAAWPGFGLQQNSDLGTTNWLGETNSIETVSGVNQVILPSSAANSFYRLSHP